ncbi:MAG: hypothetical protein ACK44R_07655, partial [Burkholderiales bacterium]
MKKINVNQSTSAATDRLSVGKENAASAAILGSTSNSVLSGLKVKILANNVIEKKNTGRVRCC